MKIVNLFEFRPVQAAYTENHVSSNEMYATVLRSFRELGLFEDLVQDGQLRSGQAALWFSETGDIWHDTRGSFGAGKRTLYAAIRHQQVPLDFVVEQDALDGTLSAYKVLYLTDRHVSATAAKKIADWVRRGGTLFATAGAGMYDEWDRPNTVLRELLGVDLTALDAPGLQIRMQRGPGRDDHHRSPTRNRDTAGELERQTGSRAACHAANQPARRKDLAGRRRAG